MTKPGGRISLSVWDSPELNPWATVTNRALVELGHAEPPDPDAPGMFALDDPDRLGDLLEDAGFVEPVVESVDLTRTAPSVDAFVDETLDLNALVAEIRQRLSREQWAEVKARIAELSRPFAQADGSLRFPARAIVAAGSA